MIPTTIANHTAVLPSGLKIAYYTQGQQQKGGDSAVVLLHGFCGSSAYWAEVLPLLQDQGLIIAPDMRGHGGSSSPEDEVYTMESFADDVEALLRTLGIERIILFGHSFGGYAAAAFAERYPHRLQAMGLVHSTGLPDTEAAKENRDKAAAAIRSEGLDHFVEGLVPKLFAPDHLIAMPDKVEAVKAIGRAGSPQGAAATARGMKVRPDRNSVLSEIGIPVLLIAGEKDGVIPSEKTFSIEGKDVTRKLLPKAGHMSMLESPGELASEMADFLKNHR